ncbi:TatD family hydrolase [Parendozoicomonas haliclonae]|uniref:Putative deoxyribonuclease YjjV n=1 Tax=Parendozoicomonas haliclonae TaxID=1960125 RepID=A0A1X7AE78_9GAMM|nr:TatD family hydrolase [Parendozoicomonas haliclonae]SMA32068.1 putative deoxyribonuclease YjjV [Parendozoicomonas haliclonae]
MLFDSHCHLDFPVFDQDRDVLLQQCAEAGIQHICIPATEREHWPRLQNLLGRHNSGVHIWGALGLHPYFLNSHKDDYLAELDSLVASKPDNIIAIGETGLDLFIDDPNLPRQEELLAAQILIAAHHGLPLILHVRKAHDQVASLLRKLKFQEGGIVHAWSGSDQQAEAFFRLGFKLGIGGSLTYDRAKRLHKQVSNFPLEHFVLETDSPDIPPAGLTNGRNTPLTLVAVLAKMSELREQDSAVIARQMFTNTRDVFRIP